PPWSMMRVYHNTFVMAGASRQAGMNILDHGKSPGPWQVFNNVFLHLATMPKVYPTLPEGDVADGNLLWSPLNGAALGDAFFAKYRASDAFAKSKAAYPAGASSHDRVLDPLFVSNPAELDRPADYRLQPTSPAIN